MEDIIKLHGELDSCQDDYIVLLETSADKSFELSILSVKYLADKNDMGIIVSANRPYLNLIRLFEQRNINISKMFILDCISKSQDADEEIDNVVFIENVAALTDISLTINEKIKNTNGKKFVLFDSITTMLIHNKPYVFARFVHNILTKMRLSGVGGILISLHDNVNKEVRAEIAQLCDKIIKI